MLPHRMAGTRYQDGTATGKLPAVMIAATPTGMRKVNNDGGDAHRHHPSSDFSR